MHLKEIHVSAYGTEQPACGAEQMACGAWPVSEESLCFILKLSDEMGKPVFLLDALKYQMAAITTCCEAAALNFLFLSVTKPCFKNTRITL